MAEKELRAKAQVFRSLHEDGTLTLPNAWDAGSAVLIAEAGAPAIGTTSGGIAWSLGRPDGQRVSRDMMIESVRQIAAMIDIPVSADVEGGYGPGPGDVAETVAAVVSAGAVGVNLEDSMMVGGPLFDVGEQSARLRAARDAASGAGLPELVINARTDVYLFGIGAPDGRQDDVLGRAAAYAAAGADYLFVPGLIDLDVLASLVEASPLPLTVMALPGGPSVADFTAAGARRVSVGTAIVQAAYTLTQQATAELLEKGSYTALEGALGFGDIDTFFAKRAG